MDLSIIIPACNVQNYIAACLRSVTRCPKDTLAMECIVVSYGSKDETAAIVNRYMQRDHRIKLVTRESDGLSAAKNTGIEESKGRYIMFLAAEDRFCEDAWEQIEAAIQEEYADFVAFSYIAGYENGKLKAKMLPISEVVSSDMQEARRLMYADCVFYACWGKLFRSDIVKLNHITFQTEHLEWDFLFVAEYFSYCASFVMSKAMILYHLQREGAAISENGVQNGLAFIKTIYEYNVDTIRHFEDANLKKNMQVYHLSVFVEFLSLFTKEFQGKKEPLEEIYKKVFQNETVKKLLNDISEDSLSSWKMKRLYKLFMCGDVKKILCNMRKFRTKAYHIKYVIQHAVWMGMFLFCTALMLSGCAKKEENTNLQEGMEFVEQYDFESAMESFDKALLNGEDLELCYRGQGLAYMGLGNYAEAETSLLKALESAGSSLTDLEYDINYYLASAYMKQGKYAQAEEIYSAITSLKKKEKDAYYLRGCARLHQNRYEDAVLDFEKAFALDPNNLQLVTDAYVEMKEAGFGEQGKTYLQEFMQKKDKNLKEGEKGVMYYYLEDYENARIYLDAFINGNDPKLSMILGQTYEKLGNLNYAAGVYQTYLDKNDPDAALYNSLGICLMNQQKYDEAIKAFESGVAMGDSDYLQELNFNLIVANEYIGNFSQAKTMIQEYLQTYPDDAKAKKENDFLKTR